MEICIIPGFSSQKGEERLRVLLDVLRAEFPEEIWVADYLNPQTYRVRSRFWALISERHNSFRDYAERVYSRISNVEADEFVIIGYSLGGVIARILVEKMNLRPKAVILVATPNKGIKISWGEKLLQKFIKVRFAEELSDNQFLSNIPALQNYHFVVGLLDRRVPLKSAVPGIAEYINREGQYGRVYAVDCGHSQLIPRDETDIKNSAIPVIVDIIVDILKKRTKDLSKS